MTIERLTQALGATLAALLLICAAFRPAQGESVERVTIENDGWALVGDLHVPDKTPAPAVLLLHKAGGSRAEYASLAGKLIQRGIGALAIDLRGHGQSTNIDTFDWQVRKNNEILEGTDTDIAAAYKLLRADARFEGQPIGVLGASYSGEYAVLAADITGFADAYVMLSPGSFSTESTEKIDPSGVPWLFIRAEDERPFFDDIFADIKRLSTTAEVRVIKGIGREGHASRMLAVRPDVEDDVADWFAGAFSPWR